MSSMTALLGEARLTSVSALLLQRKVRMQRIAKVYFSSSLF